MLDLNAEMAELWGSLGATAPGRPRLIQFVAARGGEGVSSVARAFALFAARRANRSVWLIDLDLMANGQFAAVAASPDDSMFFTVRPAQNGPNSTVVSDARYLAAHGLKGARFWVTRLRSEALAPRQFPYIVPDGRYWQVMRNHADLIVVDCPAANRSQVALITAPFMDQTVLVVAANEPEVRPPLLLRDAISVAGGHCAGVFLNKTNAEPPGFLRSILS